MKKTIVKYYGWPEYMVIITPRNPSKKWITRAMQEICKQVKAPKYFTLFPRLWQVETSWTPKTEQPWTGWFVSPKKMETIQFKIK